MPGLSNYSELVSAVGGWLFDRTDLNARIPDFIALTEARLNRVLRVRQMEARKAANSDAQYVALPADFLEARNFQVNASPAPKRLKYVSPGQADDIRLRRLDNGGTPIWFTVIADQIELLPTPSTDVEIELTYYTRIPALTEAQPTNWLLTTAPDVYLYGALLQAAPYLHEDERIVVWKSGLDEAIGELNAANDEAVHPGPLSVRRRRAYG